MKLPDHLISKNPRFSKKEQKIIITALFTKINLTCKRSSCVEIKLRKFGTIHTHRNHKRMSKLKYSRRYAKEKWKRDKEIVENSVEYLLF